MQANKKVVVGQYAVWSEIDHLHQRATCEMAKWQSRQNGKGQVMGNPAIHSSATDALVEALRYALAGRNEQFFAMFEATQHPIGVMVITLRALFGMPSPTASFAGESLSICSYIKRMF